MSSDSSHRPEGGGAPGGEQAAGGYGPTGGGYPNRAAGGKGKLVAAAGLGCVALLVVAILGVAWLFSGKKSSVATDHLPAGCQLVARMDVHEILEVPAFDKHVVPAVEETATSGKNAAKVASVLLTAKLIPTKDIGDIAVCLSGLDRQVSGGQADFVAVMGGKFHPTALLDALAKHGNPDELSAPAEREGLRVIESKKSEPKLFFGQASDGAFLVATTFELLKKAAETDSSNYKLPTEHLALVVTAAATKNLVDLGAPLIPSALGSAGRAELTASFAPGRLAARADFGSEVGASAAAMGLNFLKGLSGFGAGAPPAAKSTMNSLTFGSKGSELLIEAPIDAETIEFVAKEMANGIRQADKVL